MQTAFINNNVDAGASVSSLLLPERNTTWHLQLDDIIRVEAEGAYCRVFCNGRQYPIVVAKTLKWFEERLPAELFTRVHHGHLVNRIHIASVSGNMIILNNGYSVLMSRRKKGNVTRLLRA
jgi:two-component system LytT family response regulator